MKKIIAILLSLALLLGISAGLTEEAEKQTFGTIRANGEFTLKGMLPEGYRIVPFELDDDSIISQMISDDPARPQIILSIAFDETYSDVERMNDLDDDAMGVLEKTFTDTDPYCNITYDETAYGTRLMVVRTTSEIYDYLNILSIYKGYFVEFVMTPGKGATEPRLTDEDIANYNVFLSELDFVPGAEETAPDLRGKTYDAKITGFDKDAKTINVTILTPFTMTEWQTISFKEGDTIKIGTEDIEIGTLAYDESDVVINDEFYLTRGEDGLYTVRDFESPVLTEAQQLTLAVFDSLVFIEGIDPQTGTVLDESLTLTAADLFTALEVAQAGGVGLDSNNVKITFDENSEATSIERYYTPWQ